MKRQNCKAFTLIELLTVILIIGILSGIAVPNYRRSVSRSRAAEVPITMRSLYDACERWIWENNPGTTDEERSSYMQNPIAGCYYAMTEGNSLTFATLDMTIKGKFVEDNDKGKCILAQNFQYCFKNDKFTAYPQKEYKNQAYIEYNGQTFNCVLASNDKTTICNTWAVSTWNEVE